MDLEPINVIIGICREDNPRDVDEAYGAGTYARLFPPHICKACDCEIDEDGCGCDPVGA